MDQNTTVLLAEDNENDAFLMERAFKAHGITAPLQVMRDGAETIDYLSGSGVYSDRAKYPIPSLVILDLKMPRKSGFDVLAWLQHNPEIKIVPTLVWSSSADPIDIKRAYCLGANGFLCKPADFQKFKQMLGKVIAFWDECLRPLPDSPPTCQSLLGQGDRPME
jgi:CheY-like chemotaxis protein